MANGMEDVFGFEMVSLQETFKKQLLLYKDILTKEEFVNTSSDESVMIFGKVTKVSKIITKNDEKMAFVTLRNGREEFEITLFPKTLEFVGEKFVKGNVLILSGKKNIWNGKHSVVIEMHGSVDKKSIGFRSGSWVSLLA